jgi:hypothetical protein
MFMLVYRGFMTEFNGVCIVLSRGAKRDTCQNCDVLKMEEPFHE